MGRGIESLLGRSFSAAGRGKGRHACEIQTNTFVRKAGRGVRHLYYRFDPATSFDEPYELPCFPTMNIIKIVNAFAVDLVHPTFPSVRPRLAGHVAVQVLIGEDGRVEAATAVSGPKFAREPAVKAAYESKFRRFVRCGKPTKLSSILGYNIKEPTR